MAYSGPFQPGDRVQLTDAKRRHFTITLEPGETFFTHKGGIAHDDIIGADEGTVVVSQTGGQYLCFRHGRPRTVHATRRRSDLPQRLRPNPRRR